MQKIKKMGNKTFTIIKPDAFGARNSGPIIEKIENTGFVIKNMRLVELDQNRASEQCNATPFDYR